MYKNARRDEIHLREIPETELDQEEKFLHDPRLIDLDD